MKMKMVSGRRRQDMASEVTASGALYLFRWEYFLRYKEIYHDRYEVYGHMKEDPYGLEIDDPLDLQWAQFLVKNGYIDISIWKC